MRRGIDEIEKELNKPIERGMVSTRSGGGSKELSYLEHNVVVDELNRIFGNLSWSSETLEMHQVSDTPVTYRAKVRITVRFDDGFVIKEGYGWGSDKSKMNPHEMAVKEAESDAMKRAARLLGGRLGNYLYDKSQSMVVDYIEEEREALQSEDKQMLLSTEVSIANPDTFTTKKEYVNYLRLLVTRVKDYNPTQVIANLKKEFKFEDKLDSLDKVTLEKITRYAQLAYALTKPVLQHEMEK